MSNIAINEKGEAVFFDGTGWKPATIAQNDKGERMAFDGKEWRSLSAPKTTGQQVRGALEDVGEAINKGVNVVGTGLTKGATALLGLPNTLGTIGEGATTWAGKKLGLSEEDARKVGADFKNKMTGYGAAPSAETLNQYIFGQLGVPEANAGDVKALTLTNPFGLDARVNLGKMIDAGIQAVPGMMSLGATGLPAIVPAMTGGVASEAAGQATEGTPYEIPARVVAGGAGTLAGARAVSPLPANLSPEQQRLVGIAQERGIPLSVGQETGRGRAVESALSRFPTSEGVMRRAGDAQKQAVNREALSEMGAVGNRVDPETMRRVGREASDAFNAARNTSGDVPLPPSFYQRGQQVVAQYADDVPASGQVRAVFQAMDNFFDPKLIRPGSPTPTLSPQQYQEFRHGLNVSLERITEPTAKRALQNIREALDDAMQASLPADQAAAWQQARRNWANFKIISASAAGGGVESRSTGNLSPASLSQALRQRQGPDRFARTEGGMNDVARVAGYLADTRPNSGTPQTLAMQGLVSGGPIAGGYALGGLPGAAAAGGAMMAPNLLARAMTGGAPISDLIRNYLANQAMVEQLPQLTQGVRSVPFSLAPGVMATAPRLENRQ